MEKQHRRKSYFNKKSSKSSILTVWKYIEVGDVKQVLHQMLRLMLVMVMMTMVLVMVMMTMVLMMVMMTPCLYNAHRTAERWMRIKS